MINPSNPYHAGYNDAHSLASAPFAGRQNAYARLHTRLFDPVSSEAILFMGKRHSGKTALLHSMKGVFRESADSVYVPLRKLPVEKEPAWLLALAQIITDELTAQGYTLSRLSQLDAPGENIRAWLETTFLPQVMGAARHKVLLLVDDIEHLLAAVDAGQLPDDTFAYLLSLIRKFSNLHLAAALDSEHEDSISDLAPLVRAGDVLRLANLAPDETQWLLQEPVRGLYTVPEESTLAVQKLTGGAPALVQQFGYQLFRRWEAFPELNAFTRVDVKAVTPSVYLYAEPDYRSLWDRLTPNERIVLIAISGLMYDDPLDRIDAATLQNWLLDTDFPLDITAINATLRALEYRDLLQPTPHGISLSAEMLQTWLLENARLTGQKPRVPIATPSTNLPTQPAARPQSRISPRLLRTLAIILALLLVANVIAYAWVNGNPSVEPPNAQPTVTLANSP